VFSPRLQVGDIKPLGPVWPRLPAERVRPDGNPPKREGDRHTQQKRDDGDDDKDGCSVDEYA
jgi:hypothetical protein